MRKLLYILFFALLSGTVSAKIWEVTTSSQLIFALKNAVAFDSILVKKGHYKLKNVEITQPLTLIGEAFPTLDANYEGEVFIVKAPHVSISGFRLVNIGETSLIDWAAIKVLETNHVKIINNEFQNCYFAIYLSASEKCTVEKNKIKGTPKNEQTTGNGIHAWKCDSILISKNRIEGHRDGIYFEFVTNSLITENLSIKNIRYGLHFMFSHNDVYTHNVFTENGAGVAVMYSKKVQMNDNDFMKNWGGASYGILLKDISDSDILHNNFFSNTIGVYMEGCNRMNIQNCLFEQNGIAIRIMANCDENRIETNNFIANTFDIATNGSAVFNYLEHNYWDKYEGYDLNKDGFGDIPYRPVSLFSTVIERVPQVMVLIRSFMATLLDKIEKIIPSITPENLKDDAPMMKPNVIKPFEKLQKYDSV